MKLNQLLISLITAAVVSSPIACLSSCNSKGDVDFEDEHVQYIYNRTFSLMGVGSTKCCFGTGWIIDDATKSNNDDYCYWIATNWHVIHGNDTVGATKFYYADNSLKGSSFISQSSYQKFGSGCFAIEDKSNFLYGSQEQSEYLKSGIDFYVVKADFGSPSGKIKTKLDNLNKFRKENGYINKFVKDSSAIRNKTKYIAGYPMKTNSSKSDSGGQWEYHSLQGSSLGFYNLNTEYTASEVSGIGQKGHAMGDPYYDQQGKFIDGSEPFYYYDISPNYMSNVNLGNDWMTGGASGSMLLTEDYEICGIYWGGWSGDNAFYPAFSLFYNDAGDFVSKYTK